MLSTLLLSFPFPLVSHELNEVTQTESNRPKPVGETLDSWLEAAAAGRFWLRARYRLEHVSADNGRKDAVANTIRTAIGYETPAWNGLSGTIEFEDVSPIGNELFNSTVNGSSRQVVADPDSTEVNQAFVQYAGLPKVKARVGRQGIALDNHRFIGTVPWRQNWQSYDAVLVGDRDLEEVDWTLAYLHNVNRVFGDTSPVGDAPLDGLIWNAAVDIGDEVRIVQYVYHLDFRSSTLNNASTTTYGARLTANVPFGEDYAIGGVAEGAYQHDAGTTPNDIDTEYWNGELNGKLGPVKLRGGAEILGGTSGTGDQFTTPLATLHAFNGWADQFLVTPSTGLEDYWGGFHADAGPVDIQGFFHHFESESGSRVYGQEYDLQVLWPVSKKVTIGAKYANYIAQSFSVDTQKFWLWMQLSL